MRARSFSPCCGLAVVAALLALVLAARAEDAVTSFDAANRLYEQAKFPEAAAAYQKLAHAGQRSASVYFNLGNAYFKAGQTGRAIAAWRRTETIAPRDPSVRFNLQFARKKVSGGEAPSAPAWKRALTALTLNEWSVLAGVALWLWFALLALREVSPSLRKSLSGYTVTSGVAALLLAGCLGAAASVRLGDDPAVIIVSEAIARSGPLDEAKVLHQFRDGTELLVLDRKELGGTQQTWLQVQDAAGHLGWVKSDQVEQLKISSAQ